MHSNVRMIIINLSDNHHIHVHTFGFINICTYISLYSYVYARMEGFSGRLMIVICKYGYVFTLIYIHHSEIIRFNLCLYLRLHVYLNWYILISTYTYTYLLIDKSYIQQVFKSIWIFLVENTSSCFSSLPIAMDWKFHHNWKVKTLKISWTLICLSHN